MIGIGTIRRGRDIGKKPPRGAFAWRECPDCGKRRWVFICHNKNLSGRCIHCAVKRTNRNQKGCKAANWKGGRRKALGYILLWINSDDPFYPMANQKLASSGVILEHRLIMARHLGRCLTQSEMVHHLNSIRDDNRIQNLVIVSKSNHSTNTLKKAFQKRIRELEAELSQQKF